MINFKTQRIAIAYAKYRIPSCNNCCDNDKKSEKDCVTEEDGNTMIDRSIFSLHEKLKHKSNTG
jgi:hypothetical protein